jgi:hypothetical protein
MLFAVVQRQDAVPLLEGPWQLAGHLLPPVQTVPVRGHAAAHQGVPSGGAEAGQEAHVGLQVAVFHRRASLGRPRHRGQLRPTSGVVRSGPVLYALPHAQVPRASRARCDLPQAVSTHGLGFGRRQRAYLPLHGL